MELWEYDFPVYVAIDLIVLLFILIITAVKIPFQKIFQRFHCQLIDLRSDSRATDDTLIPKIVNNIEKCFKSNLISYNIL